MKNLYNVAEGCVQISKEKETSMKIAVNGCSRK
jgi:hypothetical protein